MMQTPILEKVAEKLEGKATIAKINVDEEQNLAARFGVQSIPTLILFKDGRQVQKMVGMQSEQALVSALESA
jgi:thioredoxin 1